MNSVEYGTIRKPFIKHVQELRTRMVWCALALAVSSFVGFMLHENLLALIQHPLGQTLYFTSPTGGFNFIFKLSITFGFVISLPVIMYHAIKFLSPMIGTQTIKVTTYTLWSLSLVYCGVIFAYIVSLPAALNFLTSFGGDNIQALITADEYFSFALAYMAGFAVLFQIPLIMLLLNRINPQNPGKLIRAQKFIILGSFIIAAILTPTPDPFNQLIMALPIILLYQVGIILIWAVNRHAPKHETFVNLSDQVVDEINAEAKTQKNSDELLIKWPVASLSSEKPTRPIKATVKRRSRKYLDILPPPPQDVAATTNKIATGVKEAIEQPTAQIDMITS